MPLGAARVPPPAPVDVHALRALACHMSLGGVGRGARAASLWRVGGGVAHRVAKPHGVCSVIWMQRTAILLAFTMMISKEVRGIGEGQKLVKVTGDRRKGAMISSSASFEGQGPGSKTCNVYIVDMHA